MNKQSPSDSLRGRERLHAQLAGSLMLPNPKRLVRPAEFRAPDAWVALGRRTQAHEQVSGRAIPVYVGIDFGTAYTKAAVSFLDTVFPIDWSGTRNGATPLLLPTEYTATEKGRCWLGQPPSAKSGDVVGGLKQEFISDTVSAPAIRRAAVFIALVLQYVRAWVFHHHAAKLPHRPLRWHFNIGTPCNGVEENERKQAYDQLQRLAWAMSVEPAERINYALASKLHPDCAGVMLADLAEHDAVPEFVAQLAGYAKSAQRRNGLHALIDVGGGTVDMVTFNVHQDQGEDVFPFFVPQVQALGTFGLINHRLQKLHLDGNSCAVPLAELSDADAFARQFGIPLQSLQSPDGEYLGAVGASFAHVLRATKTRRYRLAPEWKDGLRTFLTGGGALVEGYRRALQAAVPHGIKVDWVDLTAPVALRAELLKDLPYHRISVACGLARDAVSFGQIRPSTMVEDDLEPASQLPMKQRLHHEDIYSR